MINQRHCPFCKEAASKACSHLALAVEGRDFVRRCVELSQGAKPWRALCEQRRAQQRDDWAPNQEDFTWLETAFCDRFLKRLTWFGGMDYEWRSGPKDGEGGFWVLLWSKDPPRLWWELRDEFERQGAERPSNQNGAPWLIWLDAK
jgi:hypothetical protein